MLWNGRMTRLIRHGRLGWSFPYAEYRSDFANAAQRVLSDTEWGVFQCDLSGLDWRAGCRRLSIDKSAYYHALYSAQVRVGSECVACGLYPPGQYLWSDWEHVQVMTIQRRSA